MKLALVGTACLAAAAHGFVFPAAAPATASSLTSSSSTALRPAHTAASRCSCRACRTVVMMGRRAEKIARTKDKADAKRTKIFARIGKKIIMAVKAGGPNEDTNKLLQDIIKESRMYNVPKDNIQRAIKRAVEGSQGDFKENVYEAYGHGGVGIIITALTDNVNRAAADIKAVCNKKDLKVASSGSVAFQFTKKGKIEVNRVLDEEAVIEAAIEADVDDVEVVEGEEEGSSWVLTDATMLSMLVDGLAAAGIEGEPSLAHIPNALVDCSDEDMERNIAAIEALEALEDVDQVEHNMS